MHSYLQVEENGGLRINGLCCKGKVTEKCGTFLGKRTIRFSMRHHSFVVGKEAVSLSLFLLFPSGYFAVIIASIGVLLLLVVVVIYCHQRGDCKMTSIHWMESKTRDIHELVAVDMVSLSVSYKRFPTFV